MGWKSKVLGFAGALASAAVPVVHSQLTGGVSFLVKFRRGRTQRQ